MQQHPATPAARVVMVYVDELPLLKRLVAHAAWVLLCLQKDVKRLLGQSVARNPVLPVGLLAGLRGLAMRVVSAVQPVALHGLGCLATPSMPRSTGAFHLLSRHPLAAPLLAHTGTVCLRYLDLALRHAKVFEKCGRSRFRTYEPLACKASALPLSYAPCVLGAVGHRERSQRTGSEPSIAAAAGGARRRRSCSPGEKPRPFGITVLLLVGGPVG
jgi:hypothetical protein